MSGKTAASGSFFERRNRECLNKQDVFNTLSAKKSKVKAKKSKVKVPARALPFGFAVPYRFSI